MTALDLTAIRALADTVRLGFAPTMHDEDWDELARKAADAGYDQALIRRRQRDDRSFTHATIGSAFQLGWRKAAAGAPTLLAEIDRLTAALAELNNAITWDTTCLHCSSLLDASYTATVHAEQAEAERDALRPELAKTTARLEEASAVIILASTQLGPDHPAWSTLDGYDGSREAVRELEALGYRLSGTGGWYAPERTAPPVPAGLDAHTADLARQAVSAVRTEGNNGRSTLLRALKIMREKIRDEGGDYALKRLIPYAEWALSLPGPAAREPEAVNLGRRTRTLPCGCSIHATTHRDACPAHPGARNTSGEEEGPR